MPTNKLGYINRYYKQNRAAVVAALGNRCLICSLNEPLEIHHIESYTNGKGNGRGRITRLTDWLKNMDKLALLCKNHHMEYESLYQGNINTDSLLDYIMFKFIQNTEWCNK